MKKTLQLSAIIIISIIIPYLIISYCTLSFNISEWDGFIRFLHLFMSFWLFCFFNHLAINR